MALTLTIVTASTVEPTAFNGVGPEVIEVPISFGAADAYVTGGPTADINDFIGDDYTGFMIGGVVVDPTEAAAKYDVRLNNAGTKLMLYDGNAELANGVTLASYTGKIYCARW